MAGGMKIGKASLHRMKTLDLGGGVTKSRTVLQYRKATVSAARGATTRAIREGKIAPLTVSEFGSSLHKGVLGMADTIQGVLTDEQYRKLTAMDPRMLEAMYRSNKFVFDVYYQYAGINQAPGERQYRVAEGKAEDAQLLITEYERIWGGL